MDVRKEIESMYNQIPVESRQQLNAKDLQYFFKMTQILKQYVTDLQIKNTELYQKTADYKQRLTETEDYCLKQNDVIRQHKMYADIVGKIKILLSLSTSSSEELLYQKIEAVLDIEQRCKDALYNQLIGIKTEISAIRKTIIIQKQNLQTQDEELNKILYDWLSAPCSNKKLTIVQCLSVIADLKNVMQHKIDQFNQINKLNEDQIERSQETIKKLTFQISEQQKKIDELSQDEPSLLTSTRPNTNILASSQKLKQLEALKVQNNTLQMQRVELLNEINRLQNANRKLEQSLAITYQIPQKISKDALVNYHTEQPYNKDSETQIQKDINNLLKLNNKVIFTLNAHEQIDKLKAESDAYKLQVLAQQKELQQYKAKLEKYKEAYKQLQGNSNSNQITFIQRGRLQTENMKLKKELSQYQKVINQQESQLADMARSASQSNKQIRLISSQTIKNTSTMKENTQLKLEKEMLQEKNLNYSQQLHDALDQVVQYKNQISQLQQQNILLNDQIILAQSEKNNNLSNAAQIIQDKQLLYKEINSLKSDILKKEQEVQSLQTKNETLEKQVSEIQKKLDNTQEQLEQGIKTTNSTKNTIILFKRVVIILSSVLGISIILLIAYVLSYKKSKLGISQCQEEATIDLKHWKNKYDDAELHIKQLKEQVAINQATQVSKRPNPFLRQRDDKSDDSQSRTYISADVDSLNSSSTKEFDGPRGFENEQSISATFETASDTTIKKTTASMKSTQNISDINDSKLKQDDHKQDSSLNDSSISSKEPEKVIQMVNTFGLPEASQLTFDYSQSFPSISSSLVSVNSTIIEEEYKKIDEVRGNVGCNQYYKSINPQYIESMNKLHLYKPSFQEDQRAFAFDGDTVDEKKYGLLQQFHDQIQKYNAIRIKTVKQDETLKILKDCYYMLLDDVLNYDKIEDYLDQMISYVK